MTNQLTKLRLQHERLEREKKAAEDAAYKARRAWEIVWLQYLDEAERCGLCRYCLKPRDEDVHQRCIGLASPDEPSGDEVVPHGIIYDRLGWLCSVCGGWNHAQDKLCTHTHPGLHPESPYAQKSEANEPCEHLRSEMLAEKDTTQTHFEMRKCLDCGNIFRKRLSVRTTGNEDR